MKYVDAEKLINMIDNSIAYCQINYSDDYALGFEHSLREVKNFIDSLHEEQTDVDLKEEVKSYIKDNFTITDEVAQIPEEDRMYSMGKDDMAVFAKHFYELGKNSK